MTVRELISSLLDFNADARVLIDVEVSVEEVTTRHSNFGETCFIEAAEPETFVSYATGGRPNVVTIGAAK